MATGPHLKIALLCERALEEKDGVISIIRVVDRFVPMLPAEARNRPGLAVPLRACAVISLIRGEAERGPHRLILRIDGPGAQAGNQEVPFEFEAGGPEATHNALIILDLAVVEGRYWMNVMVNRADHLVARVPFQVAFAFPPTAMAQA